MAVSEGKFALYSRIEPPLPAGDYRLTAEQALSASGPDGPLDAAALPVASLPTHLRVRSPRFVLPPDQVLSTFPPANSTGAYGMRLPQVVIRRRTLPWERELEHAPAATPWLALVVIAEGEAELVTGRPVAECVTPGVELDGVMDSESGNYLKVRRSVINRVFPTRLDVPLLAHAREVDIHDTELMMGDDDGFLAVVIANRLPLPGRNAAGDEVPIKYLACLVNLEGQFRSLLERAPEPSPTVVYPLVEVALLANAAVLDQVDMGMVPGGAVARTAPRPKALPGTMAREVSADTTATRAPSAVRESGWSVPVATSAEIYAEMARPFARTDIGSRITGVFDPEFHFPVLLHWSFTSAGNTTFRALMEGLDSGLLGTLDSRPVVPIRDGVRVIPPRTAPPLEVVETGHAGLVHRTRRGDEVRVWYRGPFAPHPTEDPPEGRLALAHASDQLRVIIPDGREDLSLSSAFEIGRLLALSRPSMVAALLRWRQTQYQVARREAVWEGVSGFLAALDMELAAIGPMLGLGLGRRLTKEIVARSETFLGNPRPLADPGRRLDIAGNPMTALAAGFALPQTMLRGGLAGITERLRAADVPLRADLLERVTTTAPTAQLRETLSLSLDRQLTRLASDTLAPVLTDRIDFGGVVRKRKAPRADALDRLLDALDEGDRK